LKGAGINARIISAKPLPFPISHLIPTSCISYVSSIKKVLSSVALDSLDARQQDHQVPSIPLIIHIHGGGFVSGSSAMHENYLREWAIATGVPIISIDYQLAPAYKYPTQLLECFYAYKWIVSSSRLGMNASRVAVVGDSAGGNLAAALSLKCAQESVRKPDGLILHYPCLDLTSTIYPSRLLFLNDPIVPCAAAKICRESYIGVKFDENEEELKDPFISPLYASDAMLATLPVETVVTAAQFDPLSDEAIMFADRLMRVNPKASFKIYKGLPHGFLSVARYIPEVKTTINDSSSWLKDMLFRKQEHSL